MELFCENSYVFVMSVCLFFLITTQKVMDTLEFFLKKQEVEEEKKNFIVDKYDGENLEKEEA